MDNMLKQHQRMARGQDIDQGESFGVPSFSRTHKPFSEPGVHRKSAMNDGRRGISKPRGFHPAPDHGPAE